jgi:hypothetical protein
MCAERSLQAGVRGDVEFDAIKFRYNADAPLVLNDFSLKIKQGQVGVCAHLFIGIAVDPLPRRMTDRITRQS